MRRLLQSLTVAVSLMNAGSQTRAETLDYTTIVGDNTLGSIEQAFSDNPFGDTLWILNETEHGSNGPERLYAFDDLLNNPGRTAQIDTQFLMPWLLRYLWEVPHPRYTAAAWPVFMAVVPPEADLTAIAVEILTLHPHGDLRAAVLTPIDDYYPPHLEAPQIVALLPGLITADPDPKVRMAALENAAFLAYFDDALFDAPTLFQTTAETDPAPQVRAAALAALNGIGGHKPDHAFLSGLLLRPENRTVLPAMIPGVLRYVGYGKQADAAIVAAAFDVLALARGAPRFADLVDGTGWATLALSRQGRPGLERWLNSAPFGDGPALLQFLEQQFADPAVPAVDRILAVSVLHRLGRTPPSQQVYDLLMADTTGPDALDIAAETGWPLEPMLALPLDASGIGVLQALYAKAQFANAQDASLASQFRQRLVELATRRAIGRARSEGPAYLTLALDMVGGDSSDLSFGLYDLRNADTPLDLSRLVDVALTAKNASGAGGVAETLGIRYADAGDRAMLPLLERILQETTTIGVAASIAGSLPDRASLAQIRPEDDKRLAAAMTTALARIGPPEGLTYEYDAAKRWLDEDGTP